MLTILLFMSPGVALVGLLILFRYYPIKHRRFMVDKYGQIHHKGTQVVHDNTDGYNPHHVDNMGV